MDASGGNGLPGLAAAAGMGGKPAGEGAGAAAPAKLTGIPAAGVPAGVVAMAMLPERGG